MSIIHQIDIVAGEQRNHMSEVVRGSIRIDIGDAAKEVAIKAMYRKTDEAVYHYLNGEPFVTHQQAENTATVERVVDAIIQLPEFKEMRPELERYYLVNRVLDALVNRKP